jgi:prepilin-type N-terminal cleavage/methylation domain-containing protein
MQNWKISKNTQGLTLIEILITTVLLSVAFLGMGAMTVGSIRGLAFSDHMTKGITMAKERIEQIEQADYAAVIKANFPREEYGSIAGYEAFQRGVVIVEDTPEAKMKTVTVTVSWRETRGDTKDVVVSTIVAE